jgi:hypothetical protein
MNNELDRIGKETVLASPRYCFGIFREKLGKTTKNLNEVADNLGEIGTNHLQRHPYANRAGFSFRSFITVFTKAYHWTLS